MTGTGHSQRPWATLLALGAGILLYRTIALLSGAFGVLQWWVIALTFIEMAIDVMVIAACVRWWRTGADPESHLALRWGAAAAILHAVRVLVFVMGRVGPWVDFDVRPAERAMHATRWTWLEVWFAGTMAALGVIGVVVVWLVRRAAGARRPGDP